MKDSKGPEVDRRTALAIGLASMVGLSGNDPKKPAPPPARVVSADEIYEDVYNDGKLDFPPKTLEKNHLLQRLFVPKRDAEIQVAEDGSVIIPGAIQYCRIVPKENTLEGLRLMRSETPVPSKILPSKAPDVFAKYAFSNNHATLIRVEGDAPVTLDFETLPDGETHPQRGPYVPEYKPLAATVTTSDGHSHTCPHGEMLLYNTSADDTLRIHVASNPTYWQRLGKMGLASLMILNKKVDLDVSALSREELMSYDSPLRHIINSINTDHPPVIDVDKEGKRKLTRSEVTLRISSKILKGEDTQKRLSEAILRLAGPMTEEYGANLLCATQINIVIDDFPAIEMKRGLVYPSSAETMVLLWMDKHEGELEARGIMDPEKNGREKAGQREQIERMRKELLEERLKRSSGNFSHSGDSSSGRGRV